MRRLSDKRRQLLEEVLPLLTEFQYAFPFCMVLTCRKPAGHVHHIARGNSRARALCERCAWLHLCSDCHHAFHNTLLWPPARQYAIKALADTEHYDRVLLNEIRGLTPDAVDEQEVLQEIIRLIRECTLYGFPPHLRN